jgi:hypothetical protein
MKNQSMNKSLLQLVLATGIIGVAACRSSAVVQTSSEVWVGSSSTIAGNGGSSSKVSLFSQRMVRPLETAGAVSSAQNSTLVDTNSTWTDGQYGTNGVLAYVEFDNGFMADIANCSANNHSLTLAGSLGNAVQPGNAYRIRRHFTVASMFGTNNEAGLLGGLNSSTADNILLVVPQTQQTIVVFYYNDGVYHAWLNASFRAADNQIIYPEQGVMVRRRPAQDANLYLVGPVKTGATVTTIDSGFNLVGTLKSASPMSLAALNLYTGDSATGISCGLNSSTCDNVMVVQPNGSTAIYFYYKDSGYEAWLDASWRSASSVQISPGSAFFIRRRAASAPFNWTIPAE